MSTDHQPARPYQTLDDITRRTMLQAQRVLDCRPYDEHGLNVVAVGAILDYCNHRAAGLDVDAAAKAALDITIGDTHDDTQPEDPTTAAATTNSPSNSPRPGDAHPPRSETAPTAK